MKNVVTIWSLKSKTTMTIGSNAKNEKSLNVHYSRRTIKPKKQICRFMAYMMSLQDIQVQRKKYGSIGLPIRARPQPWNAECTKKISTNKRPRSNKLCLIIKTQNL